MPHNNGTVSQFTAVVSSCLAFSFGLPYVFRQVVDFKNMFNEIQAKVSSV
jgi:hypothetical protein